MSKVSRFGWLVLACTLSLPALAGEDSAESFMKARQTELSSIVRSGASSNPKRLEAAFDTVLDYDALAQGALRDHWATRSEAERKEFQDVLKRLVQRAYRKNLDRTVTYEVSFEGTEKEPGDAVLVRTVAHSKTNQREEPVSIDYVLRKVDGTWRVQDIVTEGSSLVGNYRQQFNRIIKKDGFPELIKKMKNKLGS